MADLELLVTGGRGQLGQDIVARADDTVAVRAPGSAELDVTEAGAVLDAVTELATQAWRQERSPVVINAAAYTAVDDAESDEERAFTVNADGPRVLAAVCASREVPLLHISTDYVFSGEADRPYEVDDPLGPRTAYGRTKAAGEDAVLGSGAMAWIVRTAWLYGAAGRNFVRSIARLAGERDTVSVVDDQRGSPTWSADLASAIVQLAHSIADGQRPNQRILHCTAGGETTWFSLAHAVFSELGLDPDRVRPTTTDAACRPARRPAYSVLSNVSWTDAGLTPLRPWDEALREFIARDKAALLPG